MISSLVETILTDFGGNWDVDSRTEEQQRN
jgi:hypothetical protein